jgi:hypothetical protein
LSDALAGRGGELEDLVADAQAMLSEAQEQAGDLRDQLIVLETPPHGWAELDTRTGVGGTAARGNVRENVLGVLAEVWMKFNGRIAGMYTSKDAAGGAQPAVYVAVASCDLEAVVAFMRDTYSFHG